VKFVIAIPSLLVVLKLLLAPPSFSIEKVGGAFFFWFNFVGNTFKLCKRYCYF
jgi:hypothetical protein